MSPKSGWCTSPPNTRPHCGECVSLCCRCSCHQDQTCPSCLTGLLSDTHHADCIAPLDQLSGESLSTVGESPLSEGGDDDAGWYDKGTNKTAPNAELVPPAGASSTLIRSAN